MNRCVGLLLNYCDALRSIRCAQVLLEQGCSHVLIWDNSADEGWAASEIGAKFKGDSRVTIHSSEQNLGFAAGVNRGLEYCARHWPGAWVLLINNDAVLLHGALDRLVSALAIQPAGQLAFPNISHAGTVRGWSYYHRWTGLQLMARRRGCFGYASGCCLLIAVERVTLPLFDEDFFMYGEDCELSWRLGSERSGALVHVDNTLVEHEGSAGSGSGTHFYETQLVAAHLILARKLAASRGESYWLLTLRLPFLSARAILRSLRFRSLVPLGSLWSGFQIARSRGTRSVG